MARKRSFPLPLILVLLLLGVGAFLVWHLVLSRDRIDRLVAQASKEDRSVTLSPRYEKGDTWRYRVDAKLHADMAAAGGGEAMKGAITLGANTEYYLDVLDVDAAGTAALQIMVNSIGFEVLDCEGDIEDASDLGQMGPLKDVFGSGGLEDLDSQTVQFQIDRQGRPLGSVKGEQGVGTILMGLLGTIGQTLDDRPLAPGDRWQHDLDLGEGDSVPLNLKLVGYAKHLGHDCAVIRFEADETLSETGFGFTIGVDVHLKGVLFVDTEQGHMVHIAVDGAMDLTMSGGGASATLDVTMELDMELL